MNKRLAEQVLLSLVGGVVFFAASCVKENENMFISGTWAQVDDNMMTQHLVSFVSGTYSSFEADKKYLVAEHAVWNCLEKDFECKTSSRYSVSGDMINAAGKSMRANADGETMTLDGKTYIRTDSFKEDYYRAVLFPDNIVECNFNGGNQSVSYTLRNFDSVVPSASCDAEWISDLKCTGNSVLFNVAPSTESREATIVLSYFGMEDKAIIVNQEAQRAISADPAIVYADYSAQSKSIAASVTNGASGLSFSAKSLQEWITGIYTSGANIIFNLSENNSGSKREGMITISYPDADNLEIPVFQNYSAPALIVSNSSFSLSPDAGTYTTGYSIDYPRAGQALQCISKPAWVSSVSFSGNVISFAVQANTGAGRSGIINLAYGSLRSSISISQASSSLSLSKNNLSVPAAGGQETITVTSNSAWDVSCDSEWVTIQRSSSSGDVTYLIISAALNDTDEERNAICTFKTARQTQKLNINQAAVSLQFNSAPSGISYEANTYTFSISTTGNWVVDSDQGWLTLGKTSGNGNGSISLSVTANDAPGAVQRKATVTVINTTYNLTKNFVVTQSAFTPTLSVNYSSLSGSYSAASYSIKVTSNVSWTATSNMSWLTVSPSTASANQQNTSNTLTLSASSNNSTSSRTATVSIVNDKYGLKETVVFTQNAPSGITLSVPSSVTIGAESATSSIPVTSNIDWAVKSNQSWLTFSPSQGSGNGTVTINVSTNTAVAERTAALTVYNPNYNRYESVSVIQKPYTLSVSSESWSTGASSAEKTISVTSSGSWVVEKNSLWIYLSKTSGSGNGSFTISIDSMPSAAESRTGTVTIKNNTFGISRTITIHQLRASITTNPTSWTPTFASQTSSSITISSNVSWTASSSASWLTVSKTSGSTGSSTLTLSVTENTSASARTATVTISNPTYGVSKTISVTQEGLPLRLVGSGSYPWVKSGTNTIQSNNYHVGSSTSSSNITFTTSSTTTLSFNYQVSSESGYDKLTIKVDGTTKVNAISGTSSGTITISSLAAGSHTISLTYTKDGSVNSNNDRGYISNLTLFGHTYTNSEIQ